MQYPIEYIYIHYFIKISHKVSKTQIRFVKKLIYDHLLLVTFILQINPEYIILLKLITKLSKLGQYRYTNRTKKGIKKIEATVQNMAAHDVFELWLASISFTQPCTQLINIPLPNLTFSSFGPNNRLNLGRGGKLRGNWPVQAMHLPMIISRSRERGSWVSWFDL